MRGLEFGTKVELHGLQCAVATNIVAGLYEKVLTLSPDKNKALDFVSQFDYEKKKAEFKEAVESRSRVHTRILKAFPNLKEGRYKAVFDRISDLKSRVSERIKDEKDGM